MFVLYTIKDLVIVEADALHENFREIVTLKLEEKYIGKTLKGEGLGISIYELNTHD
jgi:DNA-directed RNA polymerase subunit E'/Rpb7